MFSFSYLRFIYHDASVRSANESTCNADVSSVGCGAQVRVAAKSGVISSIDTAGDYAGFPAVCPIIPLFVSQCLSYTFVLARI